MTAFPRWLKCSAIAVLGATVVAASVGTTRNVNFWVTPDQRGQRLEERKQPQQAAKTYADPARQGAALYRAGEFKDAAAAFSRVGGDVGAYNQGTALLMHGAYDAAIQAFDRALSVHPGWPPAVTNRALAVARKAAISSQANGDEGVDEKPDEIVFDRNKKQGGDVVQMTGDQPMSDDAMRAQWLRRVQTKPADFLKAKFAYEAQTPAERPN